MKSEPVTEYSPPHLFHPQRKERLLLWIDGVGGFLVCLGHRVLLGHAVRDSDADVPILADISRQHAWIERDPEGYFLEATRPVKVNQQAVTRTVLRGGDKITLGKSCQFAFSQPVAVSASARLDLLSGHRFWRALQGVLLMAETLVLGPGSQSHVRVEELPKPLIIFRQAGGLAVRYSGSLKIHGQSCVERCSLEPGVTVMAEEIALTLEKT